MLQLPATFQRSGIIPTCATIVFISVLCNLCALSFANTISKVPGNVGFTKEIEYSEAFRIFWGRSWYIFTQIAFSMCIMCQLLASIVDVAQVVDTYVRNFLTLLLLT
jgi:amino acid permease